jgi:hypothetical protein
MGHRIVLLALAALILAATAFGPHLYQRSLPLPQQIVAEGGGWRVLTLPSRAAYHVVVHHIAKYCYSPGVGLAVEVDSASADSLFALARAVVGQVLSQAVASTDRYMTVMLEIGHGHPWPWSVGKLYFYAWYRAAPGAEWKFLSYAVPRGGKPSIADAARRKRAA